MPEEVRVKRTLLSDELKQFRYINGRLFKDLLPSAEFDAKMRQTLIDCLNFDWNKISPAIFGAMFQGVMDKAQRRELGEHYTSEENILKLINPLFMDELWREFDRVKIDPTALDRFHEKISMLKFLDPACGCGNFLIVTYRELRLLELEILKMKMSSQRVLDISPLLKVNVEQFYGIECEDFPCQVAQVGMWLMDHQMNLRASEEFGAYYVRLPLEQSATIVHGNALRLDWESVVPKEELSYILGNPPFVNKRDQLSEQKSDMAHVFTGHKNYNTLDYVSAWYIKAAQYIQETDIRVAFVATNSITQGEQVAFLWIPLLEKYKIKINFAYRTFKWTNEAKGKAAIHCIIVGFSYRNIKGVKKIYDYDGTPNEAQYISPYLVDSEPIIIEKRTKPICSVPRMDFGNMPNDGGYLCKYSKQEKDDAINKYPSLVRYFRRFYNADEFLYNIERWCIWLKGFSPSDIAKEPFLRNVINEVKSVREKSSRKETQRLAEIPYLFGEIRQPDTEYVFVPRVSSERRRYVPIAYFTPDIIAGDRGLILAEARLYHFGVLTSNVHNSWMRLVGGRLEMRYLYSINIVYNNFPWPDATDEQKAEIEKLAQAVLDARALYPESSLADLYDPLTMSPELLKAHQNLDRAVMKLYGFSTKITEAEIVAELMGRYRVLAEGKNNG